MYYQITPVAAPRMTRADKRKPHRPIVARYFAFQKEVRLKKVKVSERCRVIFFLPMPNSWSKKKKDAMHMMPHQQTPDIDNLQKALFDSVHANDKHIWHVDAQKRWSYEGGIAIETILED